MSLVDSVFGPIPGPLLETWGQDLTFVKAATSQTYNTTTGVVTNIETTTTVRGLITSANPQEFEGLYQTNDFKVTVGTTELGTYQPSIRDKIQYTEGGQTKVARIIEIKTLRGESPILHIFLARPQ